MKEFPIISFRERVTTIRIPADFIPKEHLPPEGKEVMATIVYMQKRDGTMDDPLGQNQAELILTWKDENTFGYESIDAVERSEWRALRALRKNVNLSKLLFEEHPLRAEKVFEDDFVQGAIHVKALHVAEGEDGRE